ncbi:MAG: SIMPL domain-containing protein [Granulosicoccus sp.]
MSASVMCLCLPLCAWAQAEPEGQYDVYTLSSEASVDVDNDLMIAILAVQDEDKDSAILADKINSKARWATNQLRPYATISYKTRDYQTYPRYDSSQVRRLIGWRATQTIELETDDFEAAGKAIQQLQEKLQVQSIRLSVKPETRDKATDALIVKALGQYKNRARLIQQTMSADGYRIVDLQISTEGNTPVYADARIAMSEMRSATMVAEPSIEGGSTRVTVQVYGRIHLQ